MKNKTKKKLAPGWRCCIGWMVFTAGVTLLAATLWEIDELNVGISEIIFTLTSPLEGADSGIAAGALRKCLPWVIGMSIAYGGMLVFFRRFNRVNFVLKITAWSHTFRVSSEKIFKCILVLLPIMTWVLACFTIERNLFFTSWVRSRFDTTSIYEDYFVWPHDVAVIADGKPKNLICIYLESMETTYASFDQGGFQNVNLMPNLTKLAYEGVSFGTEPGGRLGGCINVTGTGWTSAALMATTSGVPFCFPMSDTTEVGVSTQFAPNLETLGTILQENGYYQEFLCGSNATFGGRKTFFEEHGNYDIYDYYKAISTERIPGDYHVWWGFEDRILYEIAKEELTRLSRMEEPFNLTMLTVDTHFPDGYVCSLCDEGKYAVPLASIVECADRQLYEFVEWCKTQDFYEDSVIVILGDHPRMDTLLVEGVDMADRRSYNCFLNAQMPAETADFSERMFTSMDMFPTILSAMGFHVQGDRLGLGVNLFSEETTLIEQFGRDWLNTELQKTSPFYEQHFY